jgi:HSP20 family protein
MKNENTTNGQNGSAPFWNAVPTALQRLDPETDWFPAVDITQRRDEYLLEVDLPGLTADRLHVSIEGNILSIRGERPVPRQIGRRLRLERPSGKFVRRLELPDDARGAEMNAVLDNGVLELHIPRTRTENGHATAVAPATQALAA